ncbi:DUF1800 domain-containing protein [Nocardioides sp. zg-536]|uniref:DUF1800 domain-containing protein n=1 Tax=Nocardioides faecalis TaxID=2803858 RepID=A0A939BUP8_9ACTN|nr:DUF1800 domain-containing protein [Nocardioides faecalis]MBM9459101.1 DUF1800 domain-containing protein [Nocardioides faecalis]QVI57359.1 DUF1800 domain-containing protein [Nocardioides faecalis]
MQEAKNAADAAAKKAETARSAYQQALARSKAATKKSKAASEKTAAAKKKLAAAIRKGRKVARARRAYRTARKKSVAARAAAAKAAKAAAAARVAYLAAQRAAEAALARPEDAVTDTGGPSIDLIVSRFTGGYTAAQVAEIKAAGGPVPWLHRQFAPTAVDHPTVAALTSWFPELTHTPQQRWTNERSATVANWQYAEHLGNATLLRRIHSTWQVREVLTEFWSDHLHVPATSDGWYWRQDYDAMLRANALGKFTDILLAATLHPAMLYYLGNFSSDAGAVNENHARELLELHTIGVGSYVEAEVKAAGRILSGWTVNPWATPQTFHAHYDDKRHSKSAAAVAGFQSNGDGRGGQAARDLVVHLARHPDTARRLMRKLAVRLVSDDPSPALVASLTKTYLDNDTAIKPVVLALVQHPEFLASAHQKVRTEESGFVATMRALGVTVRKPVEGSDAAHNLVYSYGAPAPYSWPRPDGRPDAAAAYAGPGRVLRSFSMHSALLAGWWPTGSIDYPSPGSRLPDMSQSPTVAQVVEHVHRNLTGRPPEPAVTIASAEAIGLSATTVLPPGMWQATALADWLGVKAMAPLLDNPTHLTH